jgi:hypothetical protein
MIITTQTVYDQFGSKLALLVPVSLSGTLSGSWLHAVNNIVGRMDNHVVPACTARMSIRVFLRS